VPLLKTLVLLLLGVFPKQLQWEQVGFESLPHLCHFHRTLCIWSPHRRFFKYTVSLHSFCTSIS